MGERVDARDVLDANGAIRRAFSAEVQGYFRRTGANAWDDYEFVPDSAEDPVELMPGIPVMVEQEGCEVRMRWKGRVLRVRWIPSESEQHQLSDLTTLELRNYFLREYLDSHSSDPGIGATAVIAQKLRS